MQHLLKRQVGRRKSIANVRSKLQNLRLNAGDAFGEQLQCVPASREITAQGVPLPPAKPRRFGWENGIDTLEVMARRHRASVGERDAEGKTGLPEDGEQGWQKSA